jgi:hypothetical protein
MSLQMIILIIVAILFLWFIVFSGSSSTPYDSFIKQKNHVFHVINKWFGKNINKKLDALLKPVDPKCVKKHRTIESLDQLKVRDNEQFKQLLACGYIHNLFVVKSLSVWEDFSKLHTEQSLDKFIEYIKIIASSDPFLSGTMSYMDTNRGALEFMDTNKL